MCAFLGCCSDCACGAHSEMASFVSVMVGILLCSTFWDKPKAWLIKRCEAWASEYIDEFRKEITKDPEIQGACNDMTWVHWDKFTNEQLENVRTTINGPISTVYNCCAFVLGICGMFELLFSCTHHVGLWNTILLLPILMCVLSCLCVCNRMCSKIHQEKSHYKRHLDIVQEEAKLNKQMKEADNLVPPIPDKRS